VTFDISPPRPPPPVLVIGEFECRIESLELETRRADMPYAPLFGPTTRTARARLAARDGSAWGELLRRVRCALEEQTLCELRWLGGRPQDRWMITHYTAAGDVGGRHVAELELHGIAPVLRLQPDRPQLAASLSALTGWAVRAEDLEQRRRAVRALSAPTSGMVVDDREAWELLAVRGLIPLDWVEHPRRRFASIEWGDAGGAVMDRPFSASAAVAMASDVRGVLAAEQIAGAIANVTWPGYVPEVVLWRVVPVDADLAARLDEGWGGSADGRELFARGYALERITTREIIMVCPALEEI
jgi:hypothetical protein